MQERYLYPYELPVGRTSRGVGRFPSEPQRQRKRSRNRRQRRRNILIAGLLLVLFAAAAAGALQLINALNPKETVLEAGEPAPPIPAGQAPAQEAPADVVSQLTQMAGQYPGLEKVLQDPSAYPESLVSLFLRNPETLDFLLAYPEYKQDGPPIDIWYETQGGQVPLFLQWDTRWGYANYGDDYLAVTGCGPVCLSMVAVYLTGNAQLHPLAVAEYSEQKGYYMPGTGTGWELMTEGAAGLGLYSEELSLSEGTLRARLQAGSPVICSVGPGDFTTAGHFIVLAAENPDGGFQVYDPNSAVRSSQSWSYAQLEGQIRNLWAFSVA
ncbi:C39 family peptidase [Ruminococcaceae bacterium OttesenSCG-928-I18]|nr:C39 family peptidase [Ruminococcaceae bacterium OttesenSCG-928-I18]